MVHRARRLGEMIIVPIWASIALQLDRQIKLYFSSIYVPIPCRGGRRKGYADGLG